MFPDVNAAAQPLLVPPLRVDTAAANPIMPSGVFSFAAPLAAGAAAPMVPLRVEQISFLAVKP